MLLLILGALRLRKILLILPLGIMIMIMIRIWIYRYGCRCLGDVVHYDDDPRDVQLAVASIDKEESIAADEKNADDDTEHMTVDEDNRHMVDTYRLTIMMILTVWLRLILTYNIYLEVINLSSSLVI